jgi:hypothetical protein
MSQITCWYRFNKSTNSFDFNHFSEGFSSQNSWKNSLWKKSFAFLFNNTITGEFYV